MHYCVLAIYKLSSNEFFIFENNRNKQHITENCSKSSCLKCEYEYVECYELYEMKLFRNFHRSKNGPIQSDAYFRLSKVPVRAR